MVAFSVILITKKKHKSAFLAGAPLMTDYTPRVFHSMCTIMEKASTINRADLPIKYQPKIDGWGVQIMAYLQKFLPKEAKDFLDNCGTDGHQALQSLHLKFNLIHFPISNIPM